MSKEPTDAELIATMSGLLLVIRQLIDTTDAGSPKQVSSALNAIHEYVGICGGSILELADRHGIGDEVNGLVREGQHRLRAAQACRGIGGRA